MKSQLQFRIDAAESFVRLLQAISECAELHEKAGIPMPDIPSVVELLTESRKESDDDSEDEENTAYPPLPKPAYMTAPEGIPADWIPVPLDIAMPSSLITAHLLEKGRSVAAVDVADFVRSIQPEIATNSVYNALNRLAGNNVLAKTAEGYVLVRREQGGTFQGNYLWGQPQYMFPQELTWHRREAIIQALEIHGPLKAVQVANILQASPWLPGNLSKDNLKLDLEALAGRKWISKTAGRKWRIRKREEVLGLAG